MSDSKQGAESLYPLGAIMAAKAFAPNSSLLQATAYGFRVGRDEIIERQLNKVFPQSAGPFGPGSTIVFDIGLNQLETYWLHSYLSGTLSITPNPGAGLATANCLSLQDSARFNLAAAGGQNDLNTCPMVGLGKTVACLISQVKVSCPSGDIDTQRQVGRLQAMLDRWTSSKSEFETRETLSGVNEFRLLPQIGGNIGQQQAGNGLQAGGILNNRSKQTRFTVAGGIIDASIFPDQTFILPLTSLSGFFNSTVFAPHTMRNIHIEITLDTVANALVSIRQLTQGVDTFSISSPYLMVDQYKLHPAIYENIDRLARGSGIAYGFTAFADTQVQLAQQVFATDVTGVQAARIKSVYSMIVPASPIANQPERVDTHRAYYTNFGTALNPVVTEPAYQVQNFQWRLGQYLIQPRPVATVNEAYTEAVKAFGVSAPAIDVVLAALMCLPLSANCERCPASESAGSLGLSNKNGVNLNLQIQLSAAPAAAVVPTLQSFIAYFADLRIQESSMLKQY